MGVFNKTGKNIMFNASPVDIVLMMDYTTPTQYVYSLETQGWSEVNPFTLLNCRLVTVCLLT